MREIDPRGPPAGRSEAFALPPGCAEGFVETNGVQLHYVAAGSGPLVLLLHGFPEFWYSWRYQLPALATRFRVVAPDLRGYNLSDKPRSGYDVTTLTDDISGLVTALGARRAHVVGHDWGGALACALALRNPDRLGRLAILSAPHPALMLHELRRPRQLRRSLYIGLFQLRGMAARAVAPDDYALVRRTLRGPARP